jgi:hypothetical protein
MVHLVPATVLEPGRATLVSVRRDPDKAARVIRRTPLFYSDGPDPLVDRPRRVRAGSALVSFAGRLVVVQDDSSFLAYVDPRSGRVDSLTLPWAPSDARQFDDIRGNKRDKLDLEAALALPGADGELLVAFGSGSLPVRERIVVVDGASQVRVVHAAALYATLRDAKAFSGSELNIEGATLHGDDVLLFQRGNGARRDHLAPVNATCRLDARELLRHVVDAGPLPAMRDIRVYDFDASGATGLTFTDATTRRETSTVFFCAAAEDSPDVIRDGEVSGVALGEMDPTGSSRLVYTWLVDGMGVRSVDKVEGLAWHGERLYGVVDRDDPEVAADLIEIQLRGAWP